jgi:hypothetical protein
VGVPLGFKFGIWPVLERWGNGGNGTFAPDGIGTIAGAD